MAYLTHVDLTSSWSSVWLSKTTTTKIGVSEANHLRVPVEYDPVGPPSGVDRILDITRSPDGMFLVNWAPEVQESPGKKFMVAQLEVTIFVNQGYRLAHGDTFCVTLEDIYGPYWFTFWDTEYVTLNPQLYKPKPIMPKEEELEEKEDDGGEAKKPKLDRPIPDLPDEIWHKILKFVHPIELVDTVAPSCTRFFDLVKEGRGNNELVLGEEMGQKYKTHVGQLLYPMGFSALAAACGPHITALDFDYRDVPAVWTFEFAVTALKDTLEEVKLYFETTTHVRTFMRALTTLFSAEKVTALKMPLRFRSLPEIEKYECHSLKKLTIVSTPMERAKWMPPNVRERVNKIFPNLEEFNVVVLEGHTPMLVPVAPGEIIDFSAFNGEWYNDFVKPNVKVLPRNCSLSFSVLQRMYPNHEFITPISGDLYD